MTLEAIKREITERLREVREDSEEFSGSSAYPELQKLITKAISRVTLCETAADLEATDDLLAVIEECWNSCKTEITGQESEEGLFEFNFELDVSKPAKKSKSQGAEDVPIPEDDEEEVGEEEAEYEEEYDEDESENEYEEEEEAKEGKKAPLDVSREVEEFERAYETLSGECNKLEKSKLKSIKKDAVEAVKSAPDKATLVSTVYSYRRMFKKFATSVEKRKRYQTAKHTFDEAHPAESMTKPNIARVAVGCVALLSGVSYGLIDVLMRTDKQLWPWNEWAWTMIGFGVAYLLISAIYAIAITASVSHSIVRKMSFCRVIIAVIAATGALILGLAVDAIGVLGSYIATLPMTLFGVANYLFYRMRLVILAKKQAKATAKPQSKKTNKN